MTCEIYLSFCLFRQPAFAPSRSHAAGAQPSPSRTCRARSLEQQRAPRQTDASRDPSLQQDEAESVTTPTGLRMICTFLCNLISLQRHPLLLVENGESHESLSLPAGVLQVLVGIQTSPYENVKRVRRRLRPHPNPSHRPNPPLRPPQNLSIKRLNRLISYTESVRTRLQKVSQQTRKREEGDCYDSLIYLPSACFFFSGIKDSKLDGMKLYKKGDTNE